MTYINYNKALLPWFTGLYVITLFFPRDFWVQDEARYGEIVREMLAGGSWLIPQLNGFPYPDKPVPYFWLIAILTWLTGAAELSFRVVSVASTALTALGTYRLGAHLLGPTTGFMAALIFLSSLLTLIGGHMMRMDMPLTAVAVFAWLALWRFYQEERPSALRQFWLLVIVAFAIKGPITLLFTVLPALVWYGWERRLASLRVATGLLGLVAVVGFWITLVLTFGQGAYLSEIWHRQLVGRAVHSWSHQEPIWFYAALLPVVFMPWTPLLIIGLRHWWRDDAAQWRMWLAWTMPPLIGLSLVSGKLFIYLMPLLPALSIVAAHGAHIIQDKIRIAWWMTGTVVVYLSALAVAIAWINLNYVDVTHHWGWIVVAALVLNILLVSWSGLLSGARWPHMVALSSIGVAVTVFGGFTMLINPWYSPRALGAAITRHASPATPIGVINATRGVLNYYAGRTFTEMPRTDQHVWINAHPAAIIISKRADDLPATCRVKESFFLELKVHYVLASCSPF